MPFFSYNGIRIIGISAAVPNNILELSAFSDCFDNETIQKFSDGTGIKSVARALEEQTASDLGYAAAENLIKEKDVDVNEIGAMIFVTQSPDYRRPSSASVLHKRLGLNINCAVMEVNLGCSGFIYGLQAICGMLANSDIDKALLVLGETASKLANKKDKAIAMLYGDAGAAVLLEKTRNEERIDISLKSDGGRYKAIVLPAGGFRDMNPTHDSFMCSDGNERTLYDIHMDGTSVFSFTISDVPKTIKEFMEHTSTTPDDYDYIALHQANGFILKQLIRRFKLPVEKVPISIDKYGNTGCISIPLTLCERLSEQNNQMLKLLMSGFGIGLSWGVASLTLPADCIMPIIKTDDYYREGKLTPEIL